MKSVAGWIAIFVLLLALAPASRARAAAPGVGVFYTTSDTSGRNSGTRPAQTSVFPAGTSAVGYYYTYHGAVPGHTKAQVIENGPDGRIAGLVHTLHYAAGSYLNSFTADLAFSPGHYQFQLLLDGAPAATAAFTVQPGLLVPIFYTTSSAMYTHWKNTANAPNPQRLASFPRGTKEVGYFIGFIGVSPGRTTFRVDVYNAGKRYITGKTHTLHHVVGYFGNVFTAPFPSGAYTMQLHLAGLTRTTAFTVGP